MNEIQITSFDPDLLPCWWWGEYEYKGYDNKLKELHYDGSFIHLCLHTKYSVGNGICDIKEAIATAKKYGMKSIAVTDFCTMKGVYEFCKEAKKSGIKPIVGCEFYVVNENANATQFDNTSEIISLILLAQSIWDYRAILKMLGNSDVKYGCDKHCITVEDLWGLPINGITGIGGFMLDNISPDKISECLDLQAKLIGKCSEEIGGGFFMGIRNFNPAFKSVIMEKIYKMFDTGDIPFVGVNDIRYIHREDYESYNISKAIFINMKINALDSNEDKENYFKTAEEMEKQSEYPYAYKNAWAIAHQCDFDLENDLFTETKNKPILIKFNPDATYWKEKLESSLFENDKALIDVLIEFAKERFNCRYAAKIIAYEQSSAIDVIMQCATAMNVSSDILSLVKTVLPNESNITLDKMLKQSSELENLYRQNSEIKQLIDAAKIIQDLPWKFTTHKSAFIVSEEPPNIYFPARFYEGAPMIEWPLSTIEEIRLPKINLEDEIETSQEK